jgi:hypothetical protein
MTKEEIQAFKVLLKRLEVVTDAGLYWIEKYFEQVNKNKSKDTAS